MAVPAGTASLANIQTEFGGTNPISLSEYYGVGSVPSGIPSSGAISVNNFRGKSKLVYYAGTGGTITTSGNMKYHRFTTSGTFTVTTVGNVGSVSYMISSGGGGTSGQGNSGRNGNGSSGGGGGGKGSGGGTSTTAGAGLAFQGVTYSGGGTGGTATAGNNSSGPAGTGRGGDGGGGGPYGGGNGGTGAVVIYYQYTA